MMNGKGLKGRKIIAGGNAPGKCVDTVGGANVSVDRTAGYDAPPERYRQMSEL